MRNLKIAGATLFALLLIVAVSFSVSRQSLPPAADTPAVEQAAGHACRHLVDADHVSEGACSGADGCAGHACQGGCGTTDCACENGGCSNRRAAQPTLGDVTIRNAGCSGASHARHSCPRAE